MCLLDWPTNFAIVCTIILILTLWLHLKWRGRGRGRGRNQRAGIYDNNHDWWMRAHARARKGGWEFRSTIMMMLILIKLLSFYRTQFFLIHAINMTWLQNTLFNPILQLFASGRHFGIILFCLFCPYPPKRMTEMDFHHAIQFKFIAFTTTSK